MKRFVLSLILLAVLAVPAVAQEKFDKFAPETSQQEMVGRSAFHKSVLKAGAKRVRAGEMTRAELFRLRVAMLSPSFRERAEDLAVIQLSASGQAGDANVPVNDDGLVERASINWDGILAFIEKLIPLILQLIQIFSGV